MVCSYVLCFEFPGRYASAKKISKIGGRANENKIKKVTLLCDTLLKTLNYAVESSAALMRVPRKKWQLYLIIAFFSTSGFPVDIKR